MAFISPMQQQKDEDEEQDPSGAPTLSGVGAGTVDGGAASSQGGIGSGGKNGDQFAGINQYLDANQSKIGAFADKITGDVNKSADAARTAGDNVESEFLSSVRSGTPTLNAELGAKSLVDISKSDADKGQFLAQRDAKFTGPRGLSGAQTSALKTSGDTATSRLGNLTNEAGLQREVQQTSLNPTAGKTAFNSALLSGSSDAQQGFVQNRDVQQASINQRLQDLATTQKNAIKDAEEQAANVSRETRDRLQNETSGLNTKVRGQAAALQKERTANKSAVEAVLARGTVDGNSQEQNERAAIELFGTPDVASLRDYLDDVRGGNAAMNTFREQNPGTAAGLSNLNTSGLRPGEVDPLAKIRRASNQFDSDTAGGSGGNLDINTLLRGRGGDVTLDSAASADDFAKFQALQALSGDGVDVGLNMANIGMAGTGSADNFDFDTGAAFGSARGRRAAYDDFLSAPPILRLKR